MKYGEWFTNNLSTIHLFPYDSFLVFNTLSLLHIENHGVYELKHDLVSQIEKLEIEDLAFAPKFQIMLYSYLQNNPHDKITLLMKDWVTYLNKTTIPDGDYSFPLYYFQDLPLVLDKTVINSPSQNAYKTFIQDNKTLPTRAIVYLEALLIYHFQRNNFMIGIDLLKVASALHIRDFITATCINKLALNFNVLGYFGLYQKTDFSENEKRHIIYRTLEALIILSEYCDQYDSLEKRVFDYHAKQ